MPDQERAQQADLPPPEAVRDSLERVLASPEFTGSDRTRNFLRFIVEETLAGRAERIKAYSIALAVFDRDDGFDPLTNPVVRIEAGRLRRRLERYYLTAGCNDPVRIDVPKGGYVPSFTFQDRAQPALPEDVEGEAAAPPVQSPSVSDRWRGVSLQTLVAGLVLFALLSAGATGWLIFGREHARSDLVSVEIATPSAPVVAYRPSILVLPFENLAGDGAEDYFARGISEEILGDLVQFGELLTIDGSLSRHHRSDQSALEAGRQLNASYILAGTVRREMERVRIRARLVEVTTGRALWSGTFEEDLRPADVFAIQDAIAGAVVHAIAEPYGVVSQDISRRLQREQPSTLDAYDCLLRAYEYRRRFDPQSHATVRACLERAVEAEPDYAAAAAMLALLYLDEYRFGFNPEGDGRQGLERSLELAERAVEQTLDSALAWRALFAARYAQGELDQAFAAGEHALSLNPNNPDIKAIVGLRLALAGRWERGLALAEQAIAESPLHPGWYYFPLAFDHYRWGRYAEALSEAERIDMPGFFWTHAILAMIYGQLGRQEEAERALARTLELKPDFAARAREFVAMEVPDEDLAEKMLHGLRNAGLDG